MRHHVLTLVLFSASAILYYLGMRDSAALVIAAAGAFELVAWKRVLRRDKQRQ